jgi:hypothetical protein
MVRGCKGGGERVVRVVVRVVLLVVGSRHREGLMSQ